MFSPTTSIDRGGRFGGRDRIDEAWTASQKALKETAGAPFVLAIG